MSKLSTGCLEEDRLNGAMGWIVIISGAIGFTLGIIVGLVFG
jgi:hypothetical protein